MTLPSALCLPLAIPPLRSPQLVRILCARAGAALQCSHCYEYQDHETSDSPEPRILNVSTDSYCILRLPLAKRQYLVSLVLLHRSALRKNRLAFSGGLVNLGVLNGENRLHRSCWTISVNLKYFESRSLETMPMLY